MKIFKRLIKVILFIPSALISGWLSPLVGIYWIATGKTCKSPLQILCEW